MKDSFFNLFNKLSAIADEPDSTPEEEQQHRFLIYMGLFMSFGGILWGTISAYAGLYSVSLAPYGYTVITVCNFLYLYYTKKFAVARFIQLSISLLLPFIFQWSLGGFVASGGMMLWALLGILGAFTLQHRRSAIFWLVVYLVLTIFSGIIDKQVQLYGIEVPGEITTLFFTLNIGFISPFVFFLVYYFISSAESAQKSLEDSHLLLEQRVIERTQELQESLQKINGKNYELETLSSKLSKYLSKQIYDSIFSGQQDVKIESYRKRLTVFFSDIKDFAKLTDSLESEAMTELLNSYLNEMAEIALQYGGTIDKFIGDSIMIFFGDPETKGQKGDALACVRMAYEMRERMKALQSEWERQGVLKPLRIRIGINTGFCTVGNFGSEDRLDYTIIGGQVNLASRLESSAEPDQILISNETHALVKDSIVCEKKEEITVKGIAYPIQTYQVVGLRDKLSKDEKELRDEHKGFSLSMNYDKMDKDQALESLRTAIVQIQDQ